MKNQIIVHAADKQTRIALIENGELAQLFIESPENQRTVGDIYLAEVHKVMAGIRAAFINMGTTRDAFLHFSDTGEHLEEYIVWLNGKNALPKNFEKVKAQQVQSDNGDGKTPSVSELQNRSGALLQQKQKLLVQIAKEPIGSKGPRVTTNISLAGRFLVLMPMGDYVGVSKRIRSYKERRRLRQVVSDVLPEGFGVIIRTVADGQPDEALHEDLKDVINKWETLQEKLKSAKPPELLHRDLDMTESLVRDLFAKDYDRILIDDSKLYKSIKSYVSRVAPSMVPSIQLYKGSEHVFDYMKIGKDVDSVFSPRVKMPSGGYLIFEQTEAMYVVDVNSGRYAAKKNQEDNSLKTNLEAAREIAKQLRLRDIGGIIVVDFIDLWDDANRKKIFDELKREFRKDRAKTNLLHMSDFGLVQITRQRIRPSVVNSVSKVCPMCGGSGTIVSQNTIVADIESWLTKYRYTYKHRNIDLYVNPYLHSLLTSGFISQKLRWMAKRLMYISIFPDDTISLNDFRCMLPGSDIEITEAVMKDQSLEDAIKQNEQSIAEMEPEKKEGADIDVYKRDSSPNKSQPSRGKQGAKREEKKDTKPKPGPAPRKPSSRSKASGAAASDKKEQTQEKAAPQKGRVGSKYYKKDKKDAQQQESINEQKQQETTAKAVEKKPEKEQASETADKPRSAIEVAREHRLKKEKEEAAKAENKEVKKAKQEKETEASGEAKKDEQTAKPIAKSDQVEVKTPNQPASPEQKDKEKAPEQPAKAEQKVEEKTPKQAAKAEQKDEDKAPKQTAKPEQKDEDKAPKQTAKPEQKDEVKAPKQAAKAEQKDEVKAPKQAAKPEQKDEVKAPKH
ncbi:MAG: Rne/Rng family ribonuclease, partial [Balneolales bacterium]